MTHLRMIFKLDKRHLSQKHITFFVYKSKYGVIVLFPSKRNVFNYHFNFPFASAGGRKSTSQSSSRREHVRLHIHHGIIAIRQIEY